MATVYRPNKRPLNSRNLRGLIEYAREVAPVSRVSLVRNPPAAPEPYTMFIQFNDGALGRSGWQDWRVAARWLRSRRTWHAAGPLQVQGYKRFIQAYSCGDFGVDREEAERLLDRYRQRYPDIARMWKDKCGDR